MRLLWLALIVACSGENPARTEIDGRKSAPAAQDRTTDASRPEAADWTCPMHPEVSAPGPGACPKCGMPLVERSE